MDHEPQLIEQIIGCAIEVHRSLGPGLLENAYLSSLCVELAYSGLRFQRERRIPLKYRDTPIGECRLDLLVEDRVVVEVKSGCNWNRYSPRKC